MFANDDWWIDLPTLTSLTTTTSDSYSFRIPRHITLYGICSIEKWVIDMPALTNVTLPNTSFYYKDDVSTNCEKDGMSWWLGNIGELKTFFTDQCPA